MNLSRIQKQEELIQQAIATHGDNVNALISLFQNRQFLPENAVYHSVASGGNFYEWAVALLLRRDLKILVTEKRTEMTKELFASMPKVEEMFEQIKQYNPELIRSSDIQSAEALFTAIQKQVTYHSDLRLPGIPKADFIFTRMPRGLGNDQFEREMISLLHENGTAWMILTENSLNPGPRVIELARSKVAQFLSGYNWSQPKPGVFLGNFGQGETYLVSGAAAPR